MMMGMRIAPAALSSLLLCFSISAAQAAGGVVPQSTGKELLDFSIPLDQGPLTSSGDRVRFAKAISAVCKSYRAIVRTITPDEKAWLDKELGPDSSSERMMAALGTEIFSRNQAATILDECISTANFIATTSDHSVIWAALAQLFIRNDISDALMHVGATNADIEDIGAANLYFRETASTIIGRILIPALSK